MSDPFLLDDAMRCGVALAVQDRADVLASARGIEDAGFDSIWVGDHIAFHVPIPESLTMLSFVAAVTERVTLGTSVYLLPLREPALAAKITATLDRLSGGRLQLGVGVGGEFPAEFKAVGVPPEERGSRTDEAIELLRRLWTEGQVKHEGRHFQFGPVSIEPKPLQEGGPPILVGGRKGPSFRRAGRLGDGYISHMCSPEMYRENLDTMRGHAEAAGRRDTPFHTAAFLFTILDDDYEKAHTRAVGALQSIYRTSFEKAAQKYCLLGRPEDCCEQMQRFIDAGCRQFILSPLMNPNEFLERARDPLLPALREMARSAL
jgi:probable F420-dependent oxidoreductase